MLTKLEKQILKIAKKSPDGKGSLSAFWHLVDNNPNKSHHDVYLAVCNLTSNKYFSKFTYRTDDFNLWELSFKGRNRDELFRLALKKFLLHSVLTPIVVSFLTTILTLTIKSLL